MWAAAPASHRPHSLKAQAQRFAPCVTPLPLDACPPFLPKLAGPLCGCALALGTNAPRVPVKLYSRMLQWQVWVTIPCSKITV